MRWFRWFRKREFESDIELAKKILEVPEQGIRLVTWGEFLESQRDSEAKSK